MSFVKAFAGLLALSVLVLAVLTPWLARRVEARFPPIGRFAEVGGIRLHFIDMAAAGDGDLLPMIFLHGASGNARELAGAFAQPLAGRARMIFVDRPGAGYSGRAVAGDADPSVQAGYVAGLMDQLGIGRAVIIGHSWGGAVAAAFGVHHKEKTAGLVFISPATHPWPGADITWYYDVTNTPVIGPLFAYTLAIPFGNLRYRGAVRGVFAPNAVAKDYGERSATRLVLRPANFLANAADVGALYESVVKLQPRYREISAPTVIISGDSDDTVLADIHSEGLKRDIAGAKLVYLKNTGHIPTYTATARIIAEIEALNQRIRATEED